jgi:hypothetical protein
MGLSPGQHMTRESSSMGIGSQSPTGATVRHGSLGNVC